MRLTPLDIRKQEFKRTMRGYDPDEVNTFLEMVAEEFDTFLTEKKHLDEEVIRLRTQLHDYKDIEQTLKHALKSAQDTALQSIETSKREAELIERQAELDAEKTLRDAKVKLQELKNELIIVRAQKDSFARRLRHLLESQLELIGVLEMDDLGFGEQETSTVELNPVQEPSSQSRVRNAPNTSQDPPRRITSSRISGAPNNMTSTVKRNDANEGTSGRTGNLRRTNSNRPSSGTMNEFRPITESAHAFPNIDRKKNTNTDEPKISDNLIK